MCRTRIDIDKQNHEFKDKFICEPCSQVVIAEGYKKYGTAYWGGSKHGKVIELEGTCEVVMQEKGCEE